MKFLTLISISNMDIGEIIPSRVTHVSSRISASLILLNLQFITLCINIQHELDWIEYFHIYVLITYDISFVVIRKQHFRKEYKLYVENIIFFNYLLLLSLF